MLRCRWGSALANWPRFRGFTPNDSEATILRVTRVERSLGNDSSIELWVRADDEEGARALLALPEYMTTEHEMSPKHLSCVNCGHVVGGQ